MIYTGKFINIDNTLIYNVKIGSGNDIRYIIDNSEDTSGSEVICFSDVPVTISADTSDTFENVYIRNCSINLVSNFDVRQYFIANNYNDIPVEIRVAAVGVNYNLPVASWDIVFDGYVIPMSFNQPFALKWNEFTLECVDRLGLLEYIKFPPLLSNYNYQKPKDFMDIVFAQIGFSELADNLVYNIAYDHTNDTYINPIIFTGESEDDWMNCKEVLEEIGRIYGCYVWQDGNTAKVQNIMLYDLTSTVEVKKKDYMSDDTNISVDEAYNQIKCTVDLSTIDDTFIDPFDDENFTPTTEKAERVLTEILYKNKDKKYDNLKKFGVVISSATGIVPVRDWHSSEYEFLKDENLEIYDTYCQVMENKMFDFGSFNYLTDVPGGVAHYVDGEAVPIDKDAVKIMRWLWNNCGKAAFLSIGKTNNLTNAKNKGMPQLKDMSTKLYIQVNGDRSDIIQGDDEDEKAYNYNEHCRGLLNAQFRDNTPICSFTLNNSNNLVPNDQSVTNYLVLSGKILMTPMTPATGPIYHEKWHYAPDEYPEGEPYNSYIRRLNTMDSMIRIIGQTQLSKIYKINDACENHCVKNSDGDDGVYFQLYSWDNMQNPTANDLWPFDQDPNTNNRLALPELSPKFEKFKKMHSQYEAKDEDGDDDRVVDNVMQVSVLQCELIIGELEINGQPNPDRMHLIEDFDLLEECKWNVPSNKLGLLYKWVRYADLPTRNNVKQTWFTISIDPGMGEPLLGKQYDIRNTVTIQTGIDAEGLAIPIPYGTNLTGPVTFNILSPYNLYYLYNEYKIGIPWYLGGVETIANSNNLMDFVENIQLSDFKIELYSNSTKQNTGDNDLVYCSERTTSYIEDADFECSFCTSLRENEIPADVEYKPNNSAIMKMDSGVLLPWYGMTSYNGTTVQEGNEIKLEEARVTEQYNVWNKPRKIVETTIKLTDAEKGYVGTNYVFPYLPNQIYKITEREIDLKLNTMTCTMKDMS